MSLKALFIGCQDRKGLVGLLVFAEPRICQNLNTEIKHYLYPQEILHSLQVTVSSFLKLPSGEWKYAFTEPLPGQISREEKQRQYLSRAFACWHQTFLLHTNWMYLVFNFLLCAVISRKKEAFQGCAVLIKVLLYLSNKLPFHKQFCFVRNCNSEYVLLNWQLPLDSEPCMSHRSPAAVLPASHHPL